MLTRQMGPLHHVGRAQYRGRHAPGARAAPQARDHRRTRQSPQAVDRSSKKARDFGGWGWCSATCASSLAAIASGKTGLFFRAARAEEQLDACNVDDRSAEINFGGPVEVGARARHRHSHGRTPGGYSMPRPPPRYSGYGTVPFYRSGCRMGRAGRASRPCGCPLCSPSAADPPGPSVLPPPLRYARISWGRGGSALLCQGRCRP